jgi:hypothetical protein
MPEQGAEPIDLTHFPYFPDGDVVISLSPRDAQPMTLHSEVLVRYFSYFEQKLKGHVYLKGLARSSRIEGLEAPGKIRYELVCKKRYDWEECESEMGMLELKVCCEFALPGSWCLLSFARKKGTTVLTKQSSHYQHQFRCATDPQRPSGEPTRSCSH